VIEQRIQSSLERIGVNFYATKKSFVTDCPSCGKEEHTYIRKGDGRTICFKCGRKWSILFLIARLTGTDERGAYEFFYGVGAGDELLKPLDLDIFFGQKDTGEIDPPFPITMGLDFIGIERSPDAVSYVVSRGITDPDTIFAYDLRYHYLMNAVIFPVKKDGVTYGWQARRIAPKEGELRLISSTGFNKSDFLLNYDRARHAERIIITEGPFDCMKVDVFGMGAVCSFGKQISQSQIKQILEARSECVYVGLDPDAFLEMYDVVSRLGSNKKVFRILPPSGRKDFGECSEQEVLEAIQNARLITSPADYLELYFK
jgi:hypothetical protein